MRNIYDNIQVKICFNIDGKQKMKTILFLIFYIALYASPASAEKIALSFENNTDEVVISESFVYRYSLLPVDEIEEEGVFVGSHKKRDLEFTIVSVSYFEHLRAAKENEIGSQVNRDRITLKIGNEEFIVYWDFVETSTTWKPKVFQPNSNVSKYFIRLTPSKRTPSAYAFTITKKDEIREE
ncbi:MAG: hypothetical protein K2W94_01070 [Alphaproteobacteria bacterium]|nr:hypothetical protein [Alphaproteobacteria bacterium]